MRKILILVVLLSLITISCGQKNDQKIQLESLGPDSSKNSSFQINICQPQPVSLPNYGDPGEQLSSCFVKYPGEPSREDKSYYIVEDICGQFTPKFMENLLGRKIAGIEPSELVGVYNCKYYFNDHDYVLLNLEYLNVDKQKKGHEILGRSIETEPMIKMEHFVAWQKDGLINEIYLVLSENKFISLNRFGKALDNQSFLNLAAALAEEIKEYK